MGGRGANSKGSKSVAGGAFKNVDDFEKSLSGPNDPRLKEYSNAYEEETSYNRGLEKNLNRSIDEDGYSNEVIQSEIRETRKSLDAMPNRKTPDQLGRMEALKERLDILNNLKRRSHEKGNGRGDVDII